MEPRFAGVGKGRIGDLVSDAERVQCTFEHGFQRVEIGLRNLVALTVDGHQCALT